MRRRQRLLPVSAAVVLALGIAGCTASASQEGEALDPSTSSPDLGLVDDPEDVPEDDTDYSVDAGNDMKEYEYPDVPLPADSTLGTLCNLNQAYLAGLRTVSGGTAVVDDTLRTTLVGFSDLLSEWEMLRPHFPEHEADFDRAQALYEAWDRAVLSEENGDSGGARNAMAEAEDLLDELPADAGPDCP